MFVSALAMFLSCSCVLLGFFMLADRVMVLRLMMMMGRGVVVSSCLVMMLTRGMFRCLCHLNVPPSESEWIEGLFRDSPDGPSSLMFSMQVRALAY